MSLNPDLNELGLKSYIFIENNKIIWSTNLFQHLLFQKVHLNEKLNLYYHSLWEVSKLMQGTN